MLKLILKVISIALVVCLIWFVVFAFRPVHFTNVAFNAFVGMTVSIVATAASVAFAYRVLASAKIIVGAIVLVGCALIAFPIYGPGGMMDSVFQLHGYKYLSIVGMVGSGILTTIYCSRRWGRVRDEK